MHVSFAEGSYLELVFFKSAQGSKWETPGVADLAVLSDNADIALQQQYLNGLGLHYHGPYANATTKAVYPSKGSAGLPFVCL
jgi:hypothetical protein